MAILILTFLEEKSYRIFYIKEVGTKTSEL